MKTVNSTEWGKHQQQQQQQQQQQPLKKQNKFMTKLTLETFEPHH